MKRQKSKREVVVKVRMPKDMYDDFVDTYSFEKGTQYDKGEMLEEFLSNRIVETVAKNFLLVVKGERV